MEDILDLYAEAYDPKRPVVCVLAKTDTTVPGRFDELPYQLLAEVATPLPAEPGKPKRQDYEYERQGHCSLFISFEPAVGYRRVTVRERRDLHPFSRIRS